MLERLLQRKNTSTSQNVVVVTRIYMPEGRKQGLFKIWSLDNESGNREKRLYIFLNILIYHAKQYNKTIKPQTDTNKTQLFSQGKPGFITFE